MKGTQLEKLYHEKKYDEILAIVGPILEKQPENKLARYYSCLALSHAQGEDEKDVINKLFTAWSQLHLLIRPKNSYRQRRQLEHDRLEIAQRYADHVKPNKRHLMAGVQMPRNFSWVWPGFLISTAMFKRKEQACVIRDLNVRLVVNLMEEATKTSGKWAQELHPSEEFMLVPVPNLKAPTIEQMNQIMERCEQAFQKEQQVVVHCGGGKGRAGTVLACLMIKHGCNPGTPTNYNLEQPPISPNLVLNYLRKIRPGSLESTWQEDFLKEYHNHLRVQYQNLLNSPKSTSYPSTPYLPFSPGRDPDDSTIPTDVLKMINKRKESIIITEKMDGGNCALYQGKVYGRTHGKEATHKSFSPIKELYHGRIMPMMETNKMPETMMLFGENMTAIHSIEYSHLTSPFYLFGVYMTDRNLWLSWDETAEIAQLLDLPTVPVLFSGRCPQLSDLKKKIDSLMNEPSVISTSDSPGPREGVVMRTRNRFTNDAFIFNMAKAVRKDHIQTTSDWKGTWKKAKIVLPFVEKSVCMGADETGEELETSLCSSRDQGKGKSKDKNKTPKKKNSKLPQLVFLTGSPGSGKSTFAGQLKKAHPDYQIINQDTLGSRDACATLLSQKIKKHPVILDRCCPTAAERETWFKLAFEPKKSLCVAFDLPEEQLLFRVQNRSEHPTIPTGRGVGIVKDFRRQMELPTSEEKFGRIEIIRSGGEMNLLLQKLGAEPFRDDRFFKYPRTRHLFDAREFDAAAPCTVSRDDLLMGKKERQEFFGHLVTLEEKIDGANIGISVNSELKFMVQNRSHYVNSESHPQFKTLDDWLTTHRESLWELLGNGRYILFGEWCYAVHSCHYQNLPDPFVAFDLYDRWHEKFLSRKEFYRHLLPTTIQRVPTLGVIELKNEKQINELFKNYSEYDETQLIEGVYIRLDDPEEKFLTKRAKAVAPHFIAGITEAWDRKGIKTHKSH